jgi:HK97 family phage portal protein
MSFLGGLFKWGRKAVPAESGSLSTVHSGGSWLSIFDWRPGAWQADAAIDSKENLLAFSAVYSCVSIIASDIAKMRLQLQEQHTNGIWREVTNALVPFLPLKRKPNAYQTWLQFFEQWLVSRLLHGNAYILKERDNRRVVSALYVLDPCRVQTLVAPSGDVYYRLADDYLAGVEQQITVPASEIIHDRAITLWHPLVGVSPIYACGVSATQGRRIQNNSSKFFENMSRPSGIMTAPGKIDEVVAKRIKDDFEKKYSGDNIGRLFVAGSGLEYKPLAVNAQDAQLIEQLKWTVEDVARCFRVPLWKLQAGTMPAYGNSEIAQQAYYSETLQNTMEAIEALLVDGLELSKGYRVQFDLAGLLRMDTAARYKALSEGVKGGWLAPNEARSEENLPPLTGGDTVYLQQQQFSLEALAKRDAKDDPFAKDAPKALPAPEKTEDPDEGIQELRADVAQLRELVAATCATLTQSAIEDREALLVEVKAALQPPQRTPEDEVLDFLALVRDGVRAERRVLTDVLNAGGASG